MTDFDFDHAIQTIQKFENRLNEMEMKRIERGMLNAEMLKFRLDKIHAQCEIIRARTNKRKKALELLGNACQVCGSTKSLVIRCRLPEYLMFKPDEKYDKVIQDPASFTILCRDCQKEVIRLEKLLSRFATLKYLPLIRTKAKRWVSKYVAENSDVEAPVSMNVNDARRGSSAML